MPDAPRKFKVPGKPYSEAGKIFIAEFSDFLKQNNPHTSFPIRRIFEIFPINPATSDLAQSIIARGTVDRHNGTLINHGEFIDATFSDSSLGTIAIPIEENVTCAYTLNGTIIMLTFSTDNAPDVSFANLPENIPISSNQTLKQIEFSATGAIYSFTARDDPDEQAQIWIDFTLAPPGSGQGPRAVVPANGGNGDDDHWGQLAVGALCACLVKNNQGQPVTPTPCPDAWCNSADCVTFQDLPNGERVYGAYFVFDPFSNSDPSQLINRIVRIYNTGTCPFPIDGDPPVVPAPAHQTYRIKVTSTNQSVAIPYHLSLFGHLV